MREGRLYHCPQCLATSPTGTTCDACSIPMIDEHGNPPLRARDRTLTFANHDPSGAWVMGGIAALAGTIVGAAIAPVGLLAGPALFIGGAVTVFATQRLRVARRRRRVRGFLRGAGAAVTIAGAAPGLIRIHGKVKVLGKERFAAWERSPSDRKSLRFVVHDGSGPALVDDDCFEIWQGELRKPGGTIWAGTEIDVVGRASLRPAPDPELVGALRDSSILCFEGTSDSPVLLLI